VSAAASVAVLRTELNRFCRALLEAVGATPANAAVVVDHLIEADAMGLRSHGVMRIPQYLDDIVSGGIDPSAGPRVERRKPAQSHVDGQKGFGQVVGMAMADEAVRLAEDVGLGFVAGRHMGHTGRIGAYAQAIAAAGCVGISVCSGPRSGHWVAPFGGLDGRIATNPVAYAYPVEGGAPVVADFSTSVVPEGVIRSLRNRGLPTPEGALRDAAGNFTTDPTVLYATPRGTIQPLGGAFGYRGTALGILVDVLAALLADDEADDPAREGSNLAMLAIAVDSRFTGRAARMADYIRSARPVDAERPVMMPGEREQQEAALRGDGPILVDGPTWRAMASKAGGRIRVPEPANAG
jgi:uncharacterized oxidoreductase